VPARRCRCRQTGNGKRNRCCVRCCPTHLLASSRKAPQLADLRCLACQSTAVPAQKIKEFWGSDRRRGRACVWKNNAVAQLSNSATASRFGFAIKLIEHHFAALLQSMRLCDVAEITFYVFVFSSARSIFLRNQRFLHSFLIPVRHLSTFSDNRSGVPASYCWQPFRLF